MSLDVSALAQSMLGAALGVLQERAPEIKDYAESEFKKIAESLGMIGRMLVEGKIDEEEARLHFELQKNASRAVLLTVEGLGIIAVEQAINAALGAVKGTVNTALGISLL